MAFESLEKRLALTTFTVTNLGDGPVNFTDFVVTLREAITAANSNVAAFPGGPAGSSFGSDGIQFQIGLVGVVTLTQGELKIQSQMSIVGPGSSLVAISGGGSGARVFNVADRTTGNFSATISGLTIRQGQAPGAGGGGIANGETLRVENCVITSNSAAQGAAILNGSVGVLTIVGGRIENNFAQPLTSDDGASALFNLGRATLTGVIVSQNTGFGQLGPITNRSGATLTIQDSAITGNTQNSLVGGIDNAGTLTVRSTTISNNNSQGGLAGGVSSSGTATLLNCTISGNSASGVGGVSASGTMTLQNCTVSGNSGTGFVGGVFNAGALTMQNSTISGNLGSAGGGVYNNFNAGPLMIQNSTITLNRASSGVGGLRHEGAADMTLFNTIVVDNFRGAATQRSDTSEIFPFTLSSNNLIGIHQNFGGAANSLVDGVNGNQLGVTNPGLGPLANNGGPTQTHVVLPGSPALNTGSNGAVPADLFDLDGDGVTTIEQLPFDQRGSGFSRISGGLVDIGAVEVQLIVSADFDMDLDVDGNDFLAWQRGLGLTGATATRANGNADGDGDVDEDDLTAWKVQFGSPATQPAAGAATAATISPATADALFTLAQWTDSSSAQGLRGKRRGGRRG